MFDERRAKSECHNNNPDKIAKLLIVAGIKIILSLDFNPHLGNRTKL